MKFDTIMVDEIINIKENIKNKLKFTKVDYESKCVRIILTNKFHSAIKYYEI